MGLIGKGRKGKGQPAGTTVVAAGSRFRGELIIEASLHIDGAMEGSIESTADVSIGQSGSFDGTLRARHVMVSGYVHGKIDCERLEIVPGGKVFGEILSEEFVIEPGGQFVGESHIKGSQPAPVLDQGPTLVAPAVDGEPQQA